MTTLSQSTRSDVTRMTLYFGHHSVGANILEGVAELTASTDPDGAAAVTIAATSDIGTISPGTFAHGYVGSNTRPRSKVDAFAEVVRGGIGDTVDVAFFKFCYVDFDDRTDVGALFDYYRATMDELERTYPHTVFAHLTAPIVSRRLPLLTHAKNLVKRVIGREDLLTSRLNAKREEYNRRMREHYSSTGRLFDLALAEASAEGEAPLVVEDGSGSYYVMRSEYTSDGGHLNERGRKHVAAALLEFLSELKFAPRGAAASDTAK